MTGNFVWCEYYSRILHMCTSINARRVPGSMTIRGVNANVRKTHICGNGIDRNCITSNRMVFHFIHARCLSQRWNIRWEKKKTWVRCSMLMVHSRWSPLGFWTVKNSHPMWLRPKTRFNAALRFSIVLWHIRIIQSSVETHLAHHSRIASQPTNRWVKFINIVLTILWCHRNVFMWFEGSDFDRQAELVFFLFSTNVLPQNNWITYFHWLYVKIFSFRFVPLSPCVWWHGN